LDKVKTGRDRAGAEFALAGPCSAEHSTDIVLQQKVKMSRPYWKGQAGPFLFPVRLQGFKLIDAL
jgi:hypothetical protein